MITKILAKKSGKVMVEKSERREKTHYQSIHLMSKVRGTYPTLAIAAFCA